MVAACGKVACSRVHVVGNPDRSALSGLHFHLATLANLLAGTLVSGHDGLAGAVGARVGIHLDIVDLSVLVGVGGVSRAVAPTRTIECLQAQHVDTLQQAGHALVCIEYGLVELSVGVALETRFRTLPVVVLVVVVAGVLDEQRGDIDGVLSGSVGIVVLSLLLLALLDGFLSAGDGSVQLFERAGSVVVDGSLGGHVGTDFLSLVQHFLQLHGSLVDGYGVVEVGQADVAGLDGSEPLLVSSLLDHLPLSTGLLGTNQVQTGVGELTLPAQELVGLGSGVGNLVEVTIGGHLPETGGVGVVVGPDAGPRVGKAAEHGACALHVTLQLDHVVAQSLGGVGLLEFHLDTTDGLACGCTVTVTTSGKDQTGTCCPVVTVRVEQVAGHVVEIDCLAHLVGREGRDLGGCYRRLLPDVSIDSLSSTTACQQQCAQNK